MRESLPGATASPNIWDHPEVFERENRAIDPDRVIESAIVELIGVDTGPPAQASLLAPAGAEFGRGQAVLGHAVDIGCGNGFHLPRLAALARSVTGIEPHAGLAAAARRRCSSLANVTIRQGLAQRMPVPDASVDLAHARWAYFFGPGCEPGLAELARVCRRGALAVILDHDATRSRIGRWFAEGLRADGLTCDPVALERFWARQGFARERLQIRWSFSSTEEVAAVLAIEFPAEVVRRAVAELAGDTEVDAAVNLWWRRY